MPRLKTKLHTDQSSTQCESSPFRRRTSLAATLCAVLALSACASLGGSSPQEQVRQRATERWQALLAGEYSRAYNYNTPSFRAVLTVDGYRNRFGSAVTWLGAEVVRVECPEVSRCTAVVRIDYRPVMSHQADAKISTHVDETWISENGKWWLFQKI